MNNTFSKRIVASFIAVLMLVFMTTQALAAELDKKPVIGITWKSPTQDYAAFKKVIELAGGTPVELPQVKYKDFEYDGTKLAPTEVEKTGMLKPADAALIKARHYDKSNVAEALKGVDAVFFTGGEDISPSLYKNNRHEANLGEEINAARDVSDYTLMAYCIDHDIPVFAVCRGEQMMGIVHGAEFLQDIASYYQLLGADYGNEHRMLPGTPNRTYARHDVEVLDKGSHLYEIVKADTIKNVSSWHHQALFNLEGTGLKETARATYNGVEIIEGIENPSKTYMVGVQFHPENDVKLAMVEHKSTPADAELMLNFFKNFVKYADKK